MGSMSSRDTVDGTPFHLLPEEAWLRALADLERLLELQRTAVVRGDSRLPVAGHVGLSSSKQAAGLIRLVHSTGEARSEVVELADGRVRLLVVPLFSEDPDWLLVLQLKSLDASGVAATAARLVHAAPVIECLRAQAHALDSQAQAQAHRHALEALAQVQRHRQFVAAVMALCNTVAARNRADRVALARIDGWTARVVAVSDAERIVRHTTLVQRIEAAANETADQQEPVFLPAAAGITVAPVSRALDQLRVESHASCAAAIPLSGRDESVFAAIVIVRREPRVWEPAEALALMEVASLLGPALDCIREDQRNPFMRTLDRTAQVMRLGPGGSHPWIRLAGVVLAALLILSMFVETPHVVRAAGTVTLVDQRAVAAPFDGPLIEVRTERGGRVQAGDVMALVGIDGLTSEIEAQRAEVRALERRAATARAQGEGTAAHIGDLRAGEAKLQLDHLVDLASRAELRAPCSGLVLTGEWEEHVGQSVARGTLLFTVGTEDSWRLRLHLPEAHIHDVATGQPVRCTFLTDGFRYIDGTVVWIAPEAKVQGAVNGFTLDVAFDELPEWLRPGLRSRAEVTVGSRTWFETGAGFVATPIREWMFRLF